ncbi:MAG: bifunctional allantoicase/(S)-ureidoglycine aminohydrolase [Pseudomonadota bacterium]
MTRYATPPGGLPPQSQLLTGRAVFTEAYAVIPHGVQTDIVTSAFPHWSGARGWVLARPLTGFAETFSQTIMQVEPGGGSDQPESDPAVQAVLFVTEGTLTLSLGAVDHEMGAGGYAYLPAGAAWRVKNRGDGPVTFHWIRKAYVAADGVTPPEAFVTHEADVPHQPMPDTDGAWATQRFVDPGDMAHDFHVNIVTLQPGAVIPFAETHVMEHGLYVLQGKAVYRLNTDWVEVEAGDFLWLRAFCPQACYAGGPEPFRYLLYKDVNRLPRLSI